MINQQDPNKLFSVSQTAEFLGLSIYRVYQLINSSRINTRILGHHYYIEKAELERFAALDRKRGRPANNSTKL
jgi:excisionase family DNA binding protein